MWLTKLVFPIGSGADFSRESLTPSKIFGNLGELPFDLKTEGKVHPWMKVEREGDSLVLYLFVVKPCGHCTGKNSKLWYRIKLSTPTKGRKVEEEIFPEDVLGGRVADVSQVCPPPYNPSERTIYWVLYKLGLL